MPSKKHKLEEIIGKLREVEIVLAQGASTAEACHRTGKAIWSIRLPPGDGVAVPCELDGEP